MQDKTHHDVQNTSVILLNLANEHKRNKISIKEIKDALHERGFGLLFLVFSLPLMVPLPIPTGIGTALSVPLMFFAYQFMMNADSPWLPKWVLSKELSIDTFRKMIEKTLPYLRFVEKFLKKRLLTVSDSRKWEIFIGLFILLLQIPVALPMPLSNVIPAISIALIALGMLEKDGVMILIGKAVGIFAWIVFALMCFAVYYGVHEMLQLLPDHWRDDIEHITDTYAPELTGEGAVQDNDASYGMPGVSTKDK